MSDCGLCQDVGFVYEMVAGREFVKPCSCHRGAETVEQDPIVACRIPSTHWDCTLGSFKPRTPTLVDVYGEAATYYERFPHTGPEKGLGLLLWGATGTGKTHLAVSLLKELVANKGVSGRFWNFRALLREIARSYDPRTYMTELSVLRTALDVDLLLLDDLASEKMTDWANDTLFYIINTRYNAQRPTLITTAYEDVDRETACSADAMRRDEYLIERIGQRTRSRLTEMCIILAMETLEERQAHRKRRLPGTLAGLRRLEHDSH
jgi:DNA replication protein DnaC